MVMENSNLPVIDLNLGLKSVDNQKALFYELLAIFAKEAPNAQVAINRAFNNKQQKPLTDILHKLQGSCVYCGLLKLKAAIVTLSNSVQEGVFDQELVNQVNEEVLAVLNEIKEQKIA